MDSKDFGILYYFGENMKMDIIKDKLKLQEKSEVQITLEKYYPVVAIITILVELITILLFLIIILWEKYGMDQMKRGIVNRVRY